MHKLAHNSHSQNIRLNGGDGVVKNEECFQSDNMAVVADSSLNNTSENK